jgi:intracellular multiplication protein IcmT
MDIHWRNTQKPVRFFVLDARASLAVLLFLVHMRLWTFVLAIFIMITFLLLERRGLTFAASLRALRCWLVGTRRPGNNRRAFRYWTDYD